MRINSMKRCLLIAMAMLLLLTAAGCTTNRTATSTPMPTVNATVAATTAPTAAATAEALTEPTGDANADANAATLAITVDGKTLTEKGIDKDNTVWLPLEAVAKALGFAVQKSPSGATTTEWTITPAGSTANPVKVSYQTSGDTMSNATITKAGTALSVTEPLMMEGTTLYAAEKVFTEALGASVTADAAGNQVTVTKGATP